MGYACPVCDVPQIDGRHLANHLAFTALLGDDDHEAWLDDHVPDWAAMDEDSLAERVVPLAEERPYPQVFDDTTGEGRVVADPEDGSSDQPPSDGHEAGTSRETAAILERARELTERRRDGADDDETGDGNGDPDGG